jgi:hypothetical protein
MGRRGRAAAARMAGESTARASRMRRSAPCENGASAWESSGVRILSFLPVGGRRAAAQLARVSRGGAVGGWKERGWRRQTSGVVLLSRGRE